CSLGLSSDAMMQCRSSALVGSIVGSNERNTCAVGTMPGQPSGLSAGEPVPFGLTSPTGFPTGNVPGANTHLPVAFDRAASFCTSAATCAVAAAPTAPSVLTSGA